MKVLTPTTSPSTFTRGPPELPGIYGRVCLDVDQRRIRVDLARNCRDHAMGHSILEALRAAESKNCFTLPQIAGIIRERQHRQIIRFHLQECEVNLARHPDDLRGDSVGAPRRHRARPNIGVGQGKTTWTLSCTIHHMGTS